MHNVTLPRGTAKSGCGCFCNWHPGHNVQVVSGTGGIGVKVVCVDCHMIADALAVMHRCTPAASFEEVSHAHA